MGRFSYIPLLSPVEVTGWFGEGIFGVTKTGLTISVREGWHGEERLDIIVPCLGPRLYFSGRYVVPGSLPSSWGKGKQGTDGGRCCSKRPLKT